MPSTNLDSILSQYESRLHEMVAALPLHLMSEQKMVSVLVDLLLQLDRQLYSQVGNLQCQKCGDGIPPRRPVDLYFPMDGMPCFVEFKYWHTMLKVRSGNLEIGIGNFTPNDYSKLKDDFAKQAAIQNDKATRLILCLAQVQQYPRSTSQLMVDYAEHSDKNNARALFRASPGETLVLHHEA